MQAHTSSTYSDEGSSTATGRLNGSDSAVGTALAKLAEVQGVIRGTLKRRLHGAEHRVRVLAALGGIHAATRRLPLMAMHDTMAQPGAGRDTVLVIDDDAATLDYLQLLLTTSGYTVRTAATGAMGLSAALADSIAAVLLDRRLPDLDGVVVCQGLRDRLGPHVPIVLLTADHEPAVEAAARAAGATAFVRKPFTPPVLLDLLVTLLPR